MKRKWREILCYWKEHDGRNATSLEKNKFPQLLSDLYRAIEPTCRQNILSAFKTTGIQPLTRDTVLSKLPAEPANIDILDDTSADVTASFLQILQTLRPTIQEERRKNRRLQVEAGEAVTEQLINNGASTATGSGRKQPQQSEKRAAPIQRRRASERTHAAVDYRDNCSEDDDD